MAFQKMFTFDPRDLVRLLTHYTDGIVPLDAEVTNFGVNPFLERFVGIEVESREWEDFSPLHIRYNGRKIMSWVQGDKVEHPIWIEGNETPKRQ